MNRSIALGVAVCLLLSCSACQPAANSVTPPQPVAQPIPREITAPVAPVVVAPVAPAAIEPSQPAIDPDAEEPSEPDEGVAIVDNVEIDQIQNVIHGDDVWVRDKGGAPKHVKLRGIDAPDSGQKLSKESQEALSALVLDKKVELHWHDRDSTTALIADLYLGDEWINLRMVRDGWAWYDRLEIQNDELRDAQNEARKAKRGIWSMDHPVAPWEYRVAQQKKNAGNVARAAAVREERQQAELAKREERAQRAVASNDDGDWSSSSDKRRPGDPVQVRGHYRTSKNGKVYYVSPHTRKAPTRK